MTLAAANYTKVSEVVDYINANLKTNIQNNIVWHQGNPPPYFPSDWLSRFNNGTTLPNIAIGDIGAVGTKPAIATLYSGLQSLLLGWSSVKRVRFRYLQGVQSSYNLIYDDTQYSYLSSGYQTDVFAYTPSYKQAGNTPMVAPTITNLISALYNTWTTIGIETWEYSTCHTNCHSNCHGSGGFR